MEWFYFEKDIVSMLFKYNIYLLFTLRHLKRYVRNFKGKLVNVTHFF